MRGPRLLRPEDLELARNHVELIASQTYDRGAPPARAHQVDSRLRKWKNSWWADSVLQDLATSPALGRAAARLLGTEAVYLWEDHLIWKTPDRDSRTSDDVETGRVGWHQDKKYWQSACGEEMLTAVIALDDCTEEAGCLRFVPGSHKWGLLESGDFYEQHSHRQLRDIRATVPSEVWREVPCVLPAGFVSFHHCLTLHSSAPNYGNHDRRILSVHLMSERTTLLRNRGHLNERLTTAPEGAPLRGRFFPRLWPPQSSEDCGEAHTAIGG